MAFTLVTGDSVFPSQSPYQLIELTSNITLSWPSSFGGGVVAGDLNDVIPSADNFNIILPNATLASNGRQLIFNNVSTYSFNIMLFDGVTQLVELASGEIKQIYLYDSSTSNGLWRIIPFGSGISAITALTAESSDNSVSITNGEITTPGGTINFQLPGSINNLNQVATTGFPVITDINPSTWNTVQLTAGANITITNPDGVNGAPVINLSNILTNIASISIFGGGMVLDGVSISNITTDGNLAFNSHGTGNLIFNSKIQMDTLGNITGVKNITVSGTVINSFVPVAWCVFTDPGGGASIEIQANGNVSTVVKTTTGTYQITFANSIDSSGYGVVLSFGGGTGAMPTITQGFWASRESSSLTITAVDATGELVQSLPNGATIAVFKT
jgi:hypothetical protein